MYTLNNISYIKVFHILNQLVIEPPKFTTYVRHTEVLPKNKAANKGIQHNHIFCWFLSCDMRLSCRWTQKSCDFGSEEIGPIGFIEFLGDQRVH